MTAPNALRLCKSILAGSLCSLAPESERQTGLIRAIHEAMIGFGENAPVDAFDTLERQLMITEMLGLPPESSWPPASPAWSSEPAPIVGLFFDDIVAPLDSGDVLGALAHVANLTSTLMISARATRRTFQKDLRRCV